MPLTHAGRMGLTAHGYNLAAFDPPAAVRGFSFLWAFSRNPSDIEGLVRAAWKKTDAPRTSARGLGFGIPHEPGNAILTDGLVHLTEPGKKKKPGKAS